MIRIVSFLFLALALCLAGISRPGPAQAQAQEPGKVTFVGKSYCPIKYEIKWPFMAARDQKPVQGSGVTPNPDKKPEGGAEAKEADKLEIAMDNIRITEVPVKIGDRVSEEQVLVKYKIPLESVIAEKEYLSPTKVHSLEQSLASVDARLSALRHQREELEENFAIQTTSRQSLRSNLMDIEALRWQRDGLAEQLELERWLQDSRMTIAKSKYGKEFNPAKFPREGMIRSPVDGYVLWMNFDLGKGMVFTKPAALITVGKVDPMVIRAAVHEIEAAKLKIGDPATVVFHALPDKPIQTVISNISFVAQPAMMQQPSFYVVEITVPNPDARIKEGMRCDVTVIPGAANP